MPVDRPISGLTKALDEATLARDIAQACNRVLMEAVPDAAVFTDAAGLIRAAGTRCATVLGCQSADLIGKPLHTLVPPDHLLQHPLDIMVRDSAHPTPDGQACQVRGADGMTHDVVVRLRPFTIRGRSYHLVLFQDPAGTKPAATSGPDMDSSRDLFIATMSHELRTPLHGLIATLDMLRAERSSNADFQHQLAIARSSARALLKIANDILDLTRIKSSLFSLERHPFSLAAVLHEVVDEASARATSLGLTLSTQVNAKLPPSFIGDPARLKQILGNLVSNALKFTGKGGVELRVRHDNRTCTIDVVDTGEGIPAEKRQSIFDPFVQLPSRAGRHTGGTGLGLPISLRLAEAMGGSLVLLQSGPQGSTFRLTLPLEASSQLPLEEQSQRIFSNPRGRILVVEDNPANRYVAQALLAGLKCPATIVEGGREALETLRKQEFDLILMDCQMPGMDGYETTRRARHLLTRRVPIIAMTANAMADDRSHCLEAGMDDFLPKPFGRQELNALLCKWLVPGADRNAETGKLDARIGMHPDLDVDVLDELRESLQWRREPLEKIRASFTSSVERLLPLLANRGTANRQLLLRQLHTVLGSAGMVGARQVEHIAGQIQRAVKEDREEPLRDAAEILERATRRYEREFERRLNMGTGTDKLQCLTP